MASAGRNRSRGPFHNDAVRDGEERSDEGRGARADVMALAHSLLRDAAVVTLYRLCPSTVSASLPLIAAARAEHESERPITPAGLRLWSRGLYIEPQFWGGYKITNYKGISLTVECVR